MTCDAIDSLGNGFEFCEIVDVDKSGKLECIKCDLTNSIFFEGRCCDTGEVFNFFTN